MRLLKQRFGKASQRYTVTDLQVAFNDVSGQDFTGFFDQYIRSNQGIIDIASVLSLVGLELEQFGDEFYITKAEQPTPIQQQLYRGLVGD